MSQHFPSDEEKKVIQERLNLIQAAFLGISPSDNQQATSNNNNDSNSNILHQLFYSPVNRNENNNYSDQSSSSSSIPISPVLTTGYIQQLMYLFTNKFVLNYKKQLSPECLKMLLQFLCFPNPSTSSSSSTSSNSVAQLPLMVALRNLVQNWSDPDYPKATPPTQHACKVTFLHRLLVCRFNH